MNARGADVIVVDEVGPLELAGGGWAAALDALVNRFDGPMLLVARLALVDAVKTRWGSPSTPVWTVPGDNAGEIAGAILQQVISNRANAAAVSAVR